MWPAERGLVPSNTGTPTTGTRAGTKAGSIGSYDRWPMVVQLSDRVGVEWFKQVSPTSEVAADEIEVSGIGTIAAARVTPGDP